MSDYLFLLFVTEEGKTLTVATQDGSKTYNRFSFHFSSSLLSRNATIIKCIHSKLVAEIKSF